MKTASLTERKIKRNSRNMKARLLRQADYHVQGQERTHHRQGSDKQTRLLRQKENQGAGQDPARWTEIRAIAQSYQQSVLPFCHQQSARARGVICIQERCTISLHDLFFDNPLF